MGRESRVSAKISFPIKLSASPKRAGIFILKLILLLTKRI
jgi:hypothetical protein